MRFAYADPPYLGCGKLYAKHHPEAAVWDSIDAHAALIERLGREYPDGWALSASEPSLRQILPLTPPGTRTAAWVKPFHIFKPNVNPSYGWEPVLFFGGRKRSRKEPTVRNFHSENITLRKGLTGAKPEGFARWVLEGLLGARPHEDEVDDLFPGTGVIGRVWEASKHRQVGEST